MLFSLFFVALSSLVIVALVGAYAYWRALRTRRSLPIIPLVGMSVGIQLALVLPACLLTSTVERMRYPGDDWYDITGFCGGALQLISTPFVVAAILLICTRLERLRERRYPTACPVCGYDLRGAINATCPECGTKWLYSDEM